MIALYERDEIRLLYDQKEYARAFYLLAMADYLSRENEVAPCAGYEDIRAHTLKKTLYPVSAKMAYKLTKDAA